MKSSPRTRTRGILIKATAAIVMLALCFLVLELTARIVSPTVFHPDLRLVPNTNMRFSVNLSGVSPTISHTTNEWGFRGDAIPSDIGDYNFILAIGGSTTQCFYLDDKDTWPYLLQEMLRDETGGKIIVQNAGLDGHTTRGHLIMMENVVPAVKPDTVIFLAGLNDLGLSLDRNAFYKGSRYERTSFLYKVFAQSRLLQIASSWYRVMTGDAVEKRSGHGNLVIRELTRPEDSLSGNFEEELISLPEYESNLRELIRLGKQQGTRMIFLTQPLLYKDDQYWSGIEAKTSWLDENLYISAATYSRMLDRFNEKLTEVCEEEGVEVFDLASEIPHSMEYYYDLAHFNEKGSEIVAEKISGYLVSSGI